MINKKNKTKTLLILGILLIVLTLQNVSGIGITPGRTTINFEPGLHQEVSFSIINSEHKDMSVVLYVKGELKDRISLSQNEIFFSSQDDLKSLTYTITLPEEIEKPGLHTAEIVALENSGKDEELNGTIVGSRVAVITQLYVYVSYPGKYLELDADVIEADLGQSITFFVPVINRGKLDVKKAKAVIEIYSGINQLIDKIELDEIGILAGERKEFIGKWNASVNSGKYKAKIIVTYDGEEAVIEREFEIGEAKLEIELITVKDFVLGEIAKFNILVNNKWAEEIKDVYVRMMLYALEGNVLADFKSPSYDISPLTKMEMVAYWDTEGIEKGTYDGKLILKYGEDENEINIKVKVSNYDIEVTGLTGHVIVKKKGTFNLNNLLLMLVIFLIIANIFWFVVVKRLMKRKK